MGQVITVCVLESFESRISLTTIVCVAARTFQRVSLGARMRFRRLSQFGIGIVGVGVVSTLIGIATGVTRQCTVLGCPPSAGSGFQGIGVQGLAVVYYSGCNACTISYWVVIGVLLQLIGTVLFSSDVVLRRLSVSTDT